MVIWSFLPTIFFLQNSVKFNCFFNQNWSYIFLKKWMLFLYSRISEIRPAVLSLICSVTHLFKTFRIPIRCKTCTLWWNVRYCFDLISVAWTEEFSVEKMHFFLSARAVSDPRWRKFNKDLSKHQKCLLVIKEIWFCPLPLI